MDSEDPGKSRMPKHRDVHVEKTPYEHAINLQIDPKIPEALRIPETPGKSRIDSVISKIPDLFKSYFDIYLDNSFIQLFQACLFVFGISFWATQKRIL